MQQQKATLVKILKKNETHAPAKIMQQKKGTIVKNCKK